MRCAACTFALLVVLSPLSATAAATVGPVPTDGSVSADADADVHRPQRVTLPDRTFQISPLDPSTVIRIHLQPDRDARWTVKFRYRLETPNETAAFRRLREHFVAGEAVAGPNVAMFRTAAEQASAAAGREMQITNVNRTGSVNGNVGTLTLRFTWTNFLERGPGSTLRLGDAFKTPNGGRWISSLEPGQRIVIVTPEGYTVNSTSFQLQLQNNSVIIHGPRSLPTEEELVVTYRETDRSSPPWGLIGGGAILLALALVVAAGLYLYLARDEGGEPSPAASGESTDGGVGVDSSTEASSSAAVDSERELEHEPASSAGGAGASADADEEAVDPSLLSDEERVERLLERNGGRMKQATIVKETGWSDAKVSQLLSAMTDEGQVEKLRLGRENLISLPDADEEGSA